MKRTKEIAGEINAAGNDRATAIATALEAIHGDILAGLPDGMQAVGIRAAVRLHEERARALDHRLGGESFLPQVQAWLAARVLEITGNDKAAASALATPVGKVRRADAVGKQARPAAASEDDKRRHARHGKRGGNGERRGNQPGGRVGGRDKDADGRERETRRNTAKHADAPTPTVQVRAGRRLAAA